MPTTIGSRTKWKRSWISSVATRRSTDRQPRIFEQPGKHASWACRWRSSRRIDDRRGPPRRERSNWPRHLDRHGYRTPGRPWATTGSSRDWSRPRIVISGCGWSSAVRSISLRNRWQPPYWRKVRCRARSPIAITAICFASCTSTAASWARRAFARGGESLSRLGRANTWPTELRRSPSAGRATPVASAVFARGVVDHD